MTDKKNPLTAQGITPDTLLLIKDAVKVMEIGFNKIAADPNKQDDAIYLFTRRMELHIAQSEISALQKLNLGMRISTQQKKQFQRVAKFCIEIANIMADRAPLVTSEFTAEDIAAIPASNRRAFHMLFEASRAIEAVFPPATPER